MNKEPGIKAKLILTFFVALFPIMSHGALFLQYSGFYHTHEDDGEQFEYSRTYNYLVVGGALDNKESFFISWSTLLWSKTYKSGSGSTENEISIMELGPKVIWFMDDRKTIYISAAYHPYAKGDRTVDGTSQDVSGTSYLATLGYQLKVSRSFYLGASLNYHALSLSEKTVENTATDISESHTAVIPMLEFSIRF